MTFFLVHTLVTPPEWDDSELDALREKEKAVAHGLQEQGTLVALWREVGKLAAFSVWQSDNLEKLQENLALLPFYQFMEFEVAEISPHPNSLHPFPVPHGDSMTRAG